MHHKQLELEDKLMAQEGQQYYPPNDVVNSPSHYNKHGIEAITAIKASMGDDEFKGYLKGNILKYIWRYTYKNGLEDLLKSRWYLNKLIEELKQ